MVRLTQSEVEEADRQLFDYHKLHFKGSARVDISRLAFERNLMKQVTNGHNIRRLQKIMDIQGCQRLMRDCHVPVLVPLADWQLRVRLRGKNEFMPELDVDMDYQLVGQDHENLITAARTKLGPTDQWWIVDIYVTDGDGAIPEGTNHVQEKFIRSLREQFSNDNRPPDGLIYQRIRYYEGYLDAPANKIAANDWWAKLESVPRSKKGKYLRAFFKHPTLPEKLDQLLAVPGLWEGMQIGLLHKIIAMRCDEAITCYWELILNTFLELVGGNRELLPLINAATVGLLEARAPGVSEKDFNFLKKRMFSEEQALFPDINNSGQRHDLWERLRRINYPIPTLRTFFKDRMYLEVGRDVMRKLFIPDPERKVTIDEGVCEQYDTCVPMPMLHQQNMLKKDLCEFWRFSLQYGFEMTEHKRRVSRTRTAAGVSSITNTPQEDSHARVTISQNFFWAARERGFRVPIEYQVHTQPPPIPPLVPCDYPESPEDEIPVEQRCGKPFQSSMDADWFSLSPESLANTQHKPFITTGFLRISTFRAFFRYLMLDSGNEFPRERTSELASGHPIEHGDEIYTQFNHHPSSNYNPHVNSGDDAQVAPCTQTFEPQIPEQSALIGGLQQGFLVDVILEGASHMLTLPHNQSVISPFFEDLARHHFHVTIPSENGKSIDKGACYSYFVRNPFSRLQAELLSESSFVIYGSDDQQSRKRKRLDNSAHVDAARKWLNEQIMRFAAWRNTSQITNLSLSNIDSMEDDTLEL